MNAESSVLGFEQDFADTLRCIPFAVRYKLDRCGIKLAIEQWNVFLQDDRQQLLLKRCATEAEMEAYRALLEALVRVRNAGPLRRLPGLEADWLEVAQVPAAILTQSQTKGVSPPTLAQWQSLSDFQRYVLLKLCRPSHDNVNFAPALREFGLGA